MLTDPIADMLSRIRNATSQKHASVLIPLSKTKENIARILKEEGFIRSYEVVKGKVHPAIKIELLYREKKGSAINGLKRVSKPGLRVYTQRGEIPRVYGGLGVAILSTSQGIMAGQQAWRQGTGGELLCYIW